MTLPASPVQPTPGGDGERKTACVCDGAAFAPARERAAARHGERRRGRRSVPGGRGAMRPLGHPSSHYAALPGGSLVWPVLPLTARTEVPRG